MDEKEIIKEYFSEIGKKGGRSKSEAKLKAIAENAKRAGRPRIPDEQLTDAQKKQREYNDRRRKKSDEK